MHVGVSREACFPTVYTILCWTCTPLSVGASVKMPGMNGAVVQSRCQQVFGYSNTAVTCTDHLEHREPKYIVYTAVVVSVTPCRCTHSHTHIGPGKVPLRGWHAISTFCDHGFER